MWLSVVVKMWLAGVKYIKLSWRVFLANFSSEMSFRLSFFLRVVGIVIFFGGQFFVWTIFFNQFPMVGGWTTKDLILVYSLYLFSLSILDVFAGGVGDLSKVINAGSLDYYISFPKPILWHIAVSKSDVSSLGSVVLSLVFFIYSSPLDPLRILLFLFASCFSIVLLFNFLVATQSIAFFIGGFDQGASAVRHLLAIVSPYPFSIFPSPFKYILMTVIPSFFVVTLPARLVNNFSVLNLLILVLACVLSSFVSYKVFKAGLRRYESGNMVNVRL
jgi:ABC-2 type transport system permease protein